MEEREDDDGCEAISTQDSSTFVSIEFIVGLGTVPSLRSRGGTPDERAIASAFLDRLICDMISCCGGLLL